MSFRCRINVAIAILLLALASAAEARELRVCTEPDNLPFSNRAGEGFENKIAKLLAHEIGAEAVPVFVSWRGPSFIRSTLGAGLCEVIMGVAGSAPGVVTTQPYYRSSWMFVSRARDGLRSFDDPTLADLNIGIPAIREGKDTPPGIALGRRGLVRHLHREDSAAALVADVASGRLDVAVLWGPSAGFFAERSTEPLTLTPTPTEDRYAGNGALSFTAAVTVAVARGNTALRDDLDQALARSRRTIDAIMTEYGVPRMED
jgi:mxaJ protein